MIPDKIYIHIGPHLGLMQANKIPVGAPDEKEFVRKDSLLKWANEFKGRYPYNYAFQMMIDKINSL